MSGGNGYGYGYGQPGSSRYDAGDGAYSNGNLRVDGFNDRGAGSPEDDRGGNRDRRPGGYGGFYPEPSQQSSFAQPASSSSPERRHDRADRERSGPQQSSSRSRTRNGDADRRFQGERDTRSRNAPRYGEDRSPARYTPATRPVQGTTADMRSVEGLSNIASASLLPRRMLTPICCGHADRCFFSARDSPGDST